MEYSLLGNTNLKVSKLCFGTLTIGPLQSNLSIEEGTEVIGEAINRGVNLFDTAELYDTYKYLKNAIKLYGRDKFIISTKSYSYDRKTAEASLYKALEELDTDTIDIFSLHEQESEHTLRGHREALEYFLEMKQKGIIKAVGISTHHIGAVTAATKMKEIDVIHPIINIAGLGIQDGTKEEMLQAIKNAYDAKKGIYAMKALGGGNLLNKVDECFDFILNIDSINSVAVGMQTKEEVIANVLRFENKEIPDDLRNKISRKPRKLLIDFWCEKCGSCVEHCKHNALVIKDNKVNVITEKCVLCGYCSNYCPQFCIKII